MTLMTAKQLLDMPDPKGGLFHGRCWGPWRLDAERLVLVFIDGYEIDIETINSSAEMLDWIFQIHRKVWATPQVMADLVQALKDIFDPQANLCSFGIDERIENPKEFLRQRIRR